MNGASRRLAASSSSLWARLLTRAVVRRLAVPPGARVVAIGGATLGGSGKTPLAIACAAELAGYGARVALIGHAYRARPRCARVVSASDSVDEVGDEALVAARALAPLGARVVVAPKRADAIAFAAREANALVLDGVAQTAPVRATLALLAVDAVDPWGRAGALPPRGDLRAPIRALLDACDFVVPMASEPSGAFDPAGRLLCWEVLARARVGLLCALARPERLVRTLARRGVDLRAVVRARDHGPFGRAALWRAARAPVDVWLATPKCAVHLQAPKVRRALRAPVATLEHTVALPASVSRALASLAVP